MQFIGKLASSPSFQNNGLTDNQLQCTYAEMPAIFERLDALFAHKGITTADTVVLQSENSVPSALTLIYLIERGYSLLLLPAAADTVPTFSRYYLTTVDNDSHLDPTAFLGITPNEQWDGSQHTGDPKVYLRTSGSTGTPKMAVHSHRLLLANGDNCVERLELTSEDRVALPVPIGHMFGLGAGFLPSVTAGASIDLQKGSNLLRFIQRERAFNPNVVFLTPVFAETLIKGRRKKRAYRMTVSAGDRFRGTAFARYEERFGTLVNLYGSTEMGALAASNPNDPFDLRSTTAGKPMSGVQVRLEQGALSDADRESGLGELWAKHPAGLEGYVTLDGSLTGQDLAAQDGWFCTSDLGRILPDGRLYIMGRASHSVNRNGLLVFFSDVENAIEKLDGVETAVVVSKGESIRGQNLTAYCVLERGATVSNNEIRTASFDLLPRRAVPDNINIMRVLPLLPNGKVDRQKLVAH